MPGRLRVAPQRQAADRDSPFSSTDGKNLLSQPDLRLDSRETINSIEAFETVERKPIGAGQHEAFRALMQRRKDRVYTFKPDGRRETEGTPDFYTLSIQWE
ncbi:MAG: hypothetical protein WHS86_07330 [Desulfosoma sp.]